MSKKIVMPIYNGMRARAILRTDTYRELVKESGVELIVAVPSVKLEYYKKEFGEPNVVFEALDLREEPELGKRLAKLAFNILHTTSVRGKQLVFYHRYGGYLKFKFKRMLNHLLGPLGFLKRIIRHLDGFVPPNQEVLDFLAKHKPDLVIAPDIVFSPDRVFIRAAKRAGYYVVGMVRSWDNITSKGVIQILPDVLVVHTPTMKAEAVKYAGIPKEKIVVTGPPQFDDYFTPLTMSRDAFYKKLNISPDKRIILCSPFLDKYTKSATIIINALSDALMDGRLPNDLHLLIRYRTSTPAIEERNLRKREHISVQPHFQKFFPVITDNVPGQDWEFTYEDIEFLKHTLAYSSVVLNVDSTLSVDTAAFDKPVIDVRFDADPNIPPQHSIELLTPYFKHYRDVERSGGVKLVKNMDELIAAINAYLKNPKLDAEGRDRLRKEQIVWTDGKAGKRVTDFIKSELARL